MVVALSPPNISPRHFIQCQQHGAVLLVDERTHRVLAVTANLFEFIDGRRHTGKRSPQEILGLKLHELVREEAFSVLTALLQRATMYGTSSCQITLTNNGPNLCVTGCRSDPGVILSLEIDSEQVTRLHFHQLARRAIDHLQEAPNRDIAWLCNAAVQELKGMTGYDRVIIGRVSDDNHAQIIAEAANSDLEPLLGSYFPPAQIPRVWLDEGTKEQIPMRFIFDVLAGQVELLQDGIFGEPNGLPASPLAGVDAEQREALLAMGVRSLLLMPLILVSRAQRKVWGLIIFHSYNQPRTVPCSHRAACTFLVQALRAHLMTSVKGSERAENRRISSLQATICDRLTHQVPSVLVSETPSIQDLIPCDGVAHSRGGQVVSNGVCLSDKQIQALVVWAKERMKADDMYYTACLDEEGFLPSDELANDICGALVAPVSDTDVLLWFRKRLQVAPKWAWTDAAAGGSSSVERKTILHEARSVHWTHGELAGVKGLQRLAQETLNGNSEPMKTMMLVRLNEERLRAMQDLAMVARDLGKMMEISKTPIMGISKEMAITEWNKRMAELTGRPKASVIGKGLPDILIPQNIETTRQKLQKAMEGKAQDHVELMLKSTSKSLANQETESKAGGSGEESKGEGEGDDVGTMVLMATMTPQWDSTNEVIGVSIIGQDITEQKWMMKRFEDGAATDYKQMLDKATMPIWGVDKEGRIVEWNNAMAKTSGIAKDQAIGKSLVGELVGLEKRLMVPEKDMLLSLEFAIERALAGHETPLVGFNFVNDEGRSVDSVLNIQLRKADDSSNSTQVMCFMEDVTMRRAMEKAMAVRLAAEAAADAKTRHLAFLCHEIRNPLNGILGNISFMEDTTLSEEQKELVQTTSTCGYQLRKIVEDVLDINSIEGGKVVLECAELHFQRIVNAVISQVGLAASKKGLQLYSRVGATCGNFKPMGDAPRLQQVLSNFAWNAVKFTQQGWVELGVGMEEPQPPQADGKQFARFHFQVADSGEGIPDSLRLRLFEEFSTGRKTASSQYGGTGLGLSICQQLASLMGGDIRCQSEVGKGSTFSLDVDLQILPLGVKDTSVGGGKRIEHTLLSDTDSNDSLDVSEQEERKPDTDSLEQEKEGHGRVKENRKIEADCRNSVAGEKCGDTKGQINSSGKISSNTIGSSNSNGNGNSNKHSAQSSTQGWGGFATSPDSLSPLRERPCETLSQVSTGGGKLKSKSDTKGNTTLKQADSDFLPKPKAGKPVSGARNVPVSQVESTVEKLDSDPKQGEATEAWVSGGRQDSRYPPGRDAGNGSQTGSKDASQATSAGSRYPSPSSLKAAETGIVENRTRYVSSGLQKAGIDASSTEKKPAAAIAHRAPPVRTSYAGQLSGISKLLPTSVPSTPNRASASASGSQSDNLETRSVASGQQEQKVWLNRNSDDPMLEQAAAIAKLTDLYGDEWSFKVVREHVSTDAVAVLAEVIIRGTVRQQWGSVPCDGLSAVLAFPAATAKALMEVAALFRESSGGKVLKPGMPYSGNLWSGRVSRDPGQLQFAASGSYSNNPLSRTSSTDVQSGPVTGPSSTSNSKIGSPRLKNITKEKQQASEAAKKLVGALHQHSRRLSSNANASSLATPVSPHQPAAVEANSISNSAIQQLGRPGTLATASSLPRHFGASVSSNQAIPMTVPRVAPAPFPTPSWPVLPSPPVTLNISQPPPLQVLPSNVRNDEESMKAVGARPATSSEHCTQSSERVPATGGGDVQSSKEARSQQPDPLVSPKVLIIDDEPVNIRVVKRALDRASFEVVTGSDGTDVVDMVVNKRECYDALLLDERLKVMNGSEACMHVRDFELANGLSEMPIIAISANVEPDDVKRYAIAGYSAVMGKPINVRTVGERLRKFLASYKQMPPARRLELKRGEPVKVKKYEDIILFS